MILTERQEYIIKQLNKKGRVSLNELNKELNVTTMTIRRDLLFLEEHNLAQRIHGGAILPKRINSEFLFTQKEESMKAEKIQIAAKAAALLNEGDTVFINSGTTTLQVARALKEKKLNIITNNPFVVAVDIDVNVELVMLGGIIRKESFSVVGEPAMQTLLTISASKAIIGIDGICPERGLTSSNYLEASLNNRMITQTQEEVIVVADHTKIGRVSPYKSGSIEDISTLITTDMIDPELKRRFEEKGIRVVTVRGI